MSIQTPWSAPRTSDPVIQWTKVSSTAITGLVLNNLKTWINRPLEDTFWDTEATGLIIIAQRAIERYCEIAIAPSVWSGTVEALDPWVTLTRRPFLTVTDVKYVDPDTGTVTTVDPTTYLALPAPQFRGQLAVIEGSDWPAAARRPDAYRLTVTTGWPIVDDVPVIPEDIMHALMMTVASLDAHRGDEGGGGGHLSNTVYGATHGNAPSVIPAGAQALLAPYRLMTIWVA